MKNGVEYFSPWTWGPGMWETLHLFSRYNKNISVQAVSSDEGNVSAYTTTNSNSDSVTIALVNRSTTQPENVTLNFPDFQLTGNPVTALTLSNLPAGETFVSQSSNALQTSAVTPAANSIQLTLPPMSITSLLTAGVGSPLPLNLLTFTAVKDNSQVMLNFTTTGEVDVASFDIERRADGGAFVRIGTVPAEDSNRNEYQFRDTRPLIPTDYYRLKMINSDGSYSYSKIVDVRFDRPVAFTLYPNPAGGAITIGLNVPAGPLQLQIVDVAGRIVRSQSVESAGSPLSVSIDLNGLADGMYFVKIGGETASFLIKNRK